MTHRRLVGCGLLCGLLFASPAAAKQKPITGSAPKGYTVIALADTGRAATAVAKPAFKLVPTARVVTVQLRDNKGSYGGPLVVGGKGTKVVVGVKAGAALGKLRIKKGFAVPAKKLPARAIDKKRTARAAGGVPLGAGRLGLVRAPATGKAGQGRDQDVDGVPGAFDVDDDGDLQLDNVDRSQALASSHTFTAPDSYHPWWVMNAGLEVSFVLEDKGVTHGAAGYALNQNAAGPFASDAEFGKLRDTIMKDRGTLMFLHPSDDSATEIDCGDAQNGLPYCRPGGTGFAHNRSQKFPEQFDDDGDGAGALSRINPNDITEGQDGLDLFSGTKSDFEGIAPLAGDGQIKSGDTFIRRVSGGTNPSGDFPVTLNTVFETVPALQGWSSNGSAIQAITYPTLRGGAGSESNPFELDLGSDGVYSVVLSFWRPQRRPISAADGTGWIDQGGLSYGIVGKTVERNRTVFRCGPENVFPVDNTTVKAGDRIVDLSPDLPSSPQNLVRFNVNISGCVSQGGLQWKAGSPPVDLFIAAHDAYGDVAEGGGFAFKPKGTGPSSSQFSGTWSFPGGTPGYTVNWSVTANSAETSHFAIIVYPPRGIADGGTSPPGWTCKPGNAGGNGTWDCTGSTLHQGETVSGSLQLNPNGESGADNMPLDLLVCDAANQCSGFGMTQQK
jgi:hypothetical protein